jgi:endonuclease YncB( thermonuclease family)
MKVGEKYKVELMEGSSHGRLIGWVYLRNGTPYNVAVVKEGYAVVYSRYAKQDPRKYRQLMNALRYAKTHRTGLWREYPRIMECMERHYTEGKRYSSKGYHSQGLSLPRFW